MNGNLFWVVVLVVVSAVPAFLTLHLVVTTLLMGNDYEFPLRLVLRGPRYCPHCGKEIARRDTDPGRNAAA